MLSVVTYTPFGELNLKYLYFNIFYNIFFKNSNIVKSRKANNFIDLLCHIFFLTFPILRFG